MVASSIIPALGLGVGTFLLFFFGFLWVGMTIFGYVSGYQCVSQRAPPAFPGRSSTDTRAHPFSPPPRSLFVPGGLMFLIVLAVLTLSPKVAVLDTLASARGIVGAPDPYQSYSMPAVRF